MIIKKKRFLIRPPQFEDWLVFDVLQTDPVYRKYMPPKPLSDEEDRRARFGLICRNPNDGDLHMICCTKDDSVIGWCFLSQTQHPHSFDPENTYEIALTIHRDYWGRGYGTDVFQALIDEARYTGRINRLWEQVHVDNRASLAILEKFEFQEALDNRPDFRSFTMDVSQHGTEWSG